MKNTLHRLISIVLLVCMVLSLSTEALAYSHAGSQTVAPGPLLAGIGTKATPQGTFTVSYNANGGSGTVSASTFKIGESNLVRNNSFARTGYAFTSWNTAPDGSGTAYPAGKKTAQLTAKKGATITLYAQWTDDGTGLSYVLTKDVAKSQKSPHSYKTAESYKDVTAIVKDYIRTLGVGGYSNSPVYWNANLGRNEKNPGSWLSKPFSATVTSKGCDQLRDAKNLGHSKGAHSHSSTAAKDGCDSNYISKKTKIVHTEDGGAAQCQGFAAYMAYVVFKDNAKTSKVKWPKYTRAQVKKGIYSIKPGDIIRRNGHSIFVYDTYEKKASNKLVTYLKTIECNTGGEKSLDAKRSCRIYTSTRSMTALNEADYYVLSSPAKEIISYDVIYDINAPEGANITHSSMKSSTFDMDATENLPANTYMVAGYNFTEWNTKSDGSGIGYKNCAEITNLAGKEKSITLYAQWKKIDAKYTVTFDDNVSFLSGLFEKATGTMSDCVLYLDIPETLPKNNYRREGYTFIGWNTKDDGSGKSYKDEALVTNLATKKGATVTLYAQWKKGTAQIEPAAKTYTILYNANGGTGTMSESEFTIGQPASLRANTFTRKDYSFIGWNTDKNGSGTAYTDKHQVLDLNPSANACLTLYAQWEHTGTQNYLKSCTVYKSAVKVKVTSADAYLKALPCSESTNEYSKSLRKLNKNEVFTATALYKNSQGNYWYQVKDGNGETGYIYAAQASAQGLASGTVNINVKLEKTKIPENNTCQISGSVSSTGVTLKSVKGILRDANGKTQQADTTSKFNKIESTDINYDLGFKKCCRGDGTLTIYAYVDSYESPNGKTLVQTSVQKTLKFTITATYSVIFNANGGDNAPANQKKTFGQSLTLTTATPTRSGYTFVGWATSKSANAPEYLPGAKLTKDLPTGNLTLYALWEEAHDNVYIVDNNGSEKVYWLLGENGSEQVADCDLTQLNHITMRWVPSHEDLAQSTVYCCDVMMSFKNGVLDFYISDGSYGFDFPALSAVSPDQNNCIFTFSEDTQIDLNVCLLNFHSNGGAIDGATAIEFCLFATDHLSINTATLLPDVTRDGHSLLGWATSPDATAAEFSTEFTLPLTADTTLYAVWEKDNDDTGDTPPTEDHSTYVAYDDGNGLKCYRIVEKQDGGQTYKDTELVEDYDINQLNHVTMYFNWKTSIGHDSEISTVCFYPMHMFMEAKNDVLEFYVSDGTHQLDFHFLSPVPGGSARSFEINGDHNFYLDVYSLWLDGNGGTIDGSQTSPTYILLSMDQFALDTTIYNVEREGHTLDGWAKTPDAAYGEYVGTVHSCFLDNTVLYAVWSNDEDSSTDTYIISYDALGGIGAPEDQCKTEGEPLILSSSIPTLENHSFAGWSLHPSATEVDYAPGATYTTDGAIILYAVWIKNTTE